MQMVDEEIKRLNGEEVKEEDLDSKSLVNVSTHISDDYVSDEEVKIEIHQLINEIEDEESLQNIKTVLEDRFGKITKEIEVYMYEEWFEKIAKKFEISKVVQNDRMIELEIPAKYSERIKGDKLFLEAYNINRNFNFKYVNKKILITLLLKQGQKHFLYYFVPLLELVWQDIENSFR